MTTMMRSAIVAILAVSVVPLAASADTSVFSGQNAYGNIIGVSDSGAGYIELQAYVFQSATKDNSGKTNFSGADVFEYIDIGDGITYYCGYGSTTDNVKFAKGNSTIVASGSVQIDLYDCNNGQLSGTDNVSFNMNLAATRNQANSQWGTDHNEYGPTKVNYHFDYVNYPASTTASGITSEHYGAITVEVAELGQSKNHTWKSQGSC